MYVISMYLYAWCFFLKYVDVHNPEKLDDSKLHCDDGINVVFPDANMLVLEELTLMRLFYPRWIR